MRLQLDLGSDRTLVFEDYSDTDYLKVSVEDNNGISTITLGLVKREDIKRLGKSC
jgi:hypothetical protein|tara:strand:+ start:161 stop:325 length:165 start_codon:yes stop_codon:yes gene_type:complete